VPDDAVPLPHTELEPVHVVVAAQAGAPVHAVPAGLNWQVALQQDAAVPFAAPSSHCSPWLGWTLPFPHGWAATSEGEPSISAKTKAKAKPGSGPEDLAAIGRTSGVECMRGCSTWCAPDANAHWARKPGGP
jgi:hypothetical protein